MSEPPRAIRANSPLPKLCLRCGYVIDHLGATGYCPECGNAFDINDPRTYTIDTPFLWWPFWLPALLTASICGAALYLLLIPVFGYTYSTTLAVPLAVGVLLGYRLRLGKAASIVMGIAVTFSLLITLFTAKLAGGLCVFVLSMLIVGPLLIGALFGTLLRNILKQSKFSQRAHLPILLIAPILLAIFEGRHDGMAVVSTSTVAVINAPPDLAWNAIQFYEQVHHRPPLLLWASPSLRPEYTTGSSQHVGDRKICVYQRGRLVKEITEVVPGKRLAFRVIEQTDIENDGVRLIDGSFDLAPTADGHATIVTLTTRYEPKLAPRFAYLPAENWAVHTLHGHVLRGMTEDAEQAKARLPASSLNGASHQQ